MGSTRPPIGVALPLAAVVAVLLVGCGGSGDDADRASGRATAGGDRAVTIEDYLYEPARITVAKGATIAFTNRDSTPHTATSKAPGGFESGSIKTGKSGQLRLEETGTFAYYCVFHPFMKGTIVVE